MDERIFLSVVGGGLYVLKADGLASPFMRVTRLKRVPPSKTLGILLQLAIKPIDARSRTSCRGFFIWTLIKISKKIEIRIA